MLTIHLSEKIYYFWIVHNYPKSWNCWNMYKKIKGILFDFDGVIAESEQIWFGTALVTLKKMGIKYDRSIKQKSTIGIISECPVTLADSKGCKSTS